jgi:hypothetical protein
MTAFESFTEQIYTAFVFVVIGPVGLSSTSISPRLVAKN